MLDDQLKGNGFGAVVINFDLPEQIYSSKTAGFCVRNLEPIKPNHYGTRHRAVFSHRWENCGSLGFVGSQDGESRAITKIENQLIIWKNIRVHHLFKSSKFNRILYNKRK